MLLTMDAVIEAAGQINAQEGTAYEQMAAVVGIENAGDFVEEFSNSYTGEVLALTAAISPGAAAVSLIAAGMLLERGQNEAQAAPETEEE